MHATNEITAEQILASVNIVDIVSEHSQLKRNGKELVCLCPIHNEKTPSCYINENKQVFHCRGCGAGGSAVDFLAALYQVSIGDAFAILKERIGYAPGQQRESPPARLTEKGALVQHMRNNAIVETPYFF